MIRFCYQNKADSATVSASSQVASLPAANVQHFWKSKPWRATGCTSEWLKLNLGSAQSILAVILTGHNLTSGATVHFQANATDVWTSPSVDATVPWSARDLVYLWNAAQSYQWWRITIADASNPDGFVQAGRVYIGPAPSPDRNFTSYKRTVVDPTVISPSTDGAESFEDKTPYYVFTFEFARVLVDEFENLRKTVGMKDYFWVIADYENVLEADGRHDLTAYVRFDALPEYGHVYMTRKSVSLNLREAL